MSFSPAALLKRSRLIITGGILVALLSAVVSFVFPLEYRADAQILVIARGQYGVDPFTVAKSSERMAESLSYAVETDDFAARVKMVLPQELQASLTKSTPRKTRKAWVRAADASALFGKSVLSVSGFGKTPDTAKAVTQAIADTIVQSGSDYVGTLITARVVNEPIASSYPVRPNIILNALIGFLIGALLIAGYVVRREQ